MKVIDAKLHQNRLDPNDGTTLTMTDRYGAAGEQRNLAANGNSPFALLYIINCIIAVLGSHSRVWHPCISTPAHPSNATLAPRWACRLALCWWLWAGWWEARRRRQPSPPSSNLHPLLCCAAGDLPIKTCPCSRNHICILVRRLPLPLYLQNLHQLVCVGWATVPTCPISTNPVKLWENKVSTWLFEPHLHIEPETRRA